MQEWNATKRSYVMRAPFGNAACSRSVTSISGATSEILSNSIVTSAARDHLQAPLLLVRFRIFFARGSIVMRHDCQLTGREHNFRTDREKKFLLEGNLPQDGQFHEQRKMQAWNATQRSYVIRAPFGNAACFRRNERNPFKFDCHVEPRATIYKHRCCLCDFVFFRPQSS